MIEPPFDKLETIRRALVEVRAAVPDGWTDLVAVFSQSRGERLLLIYNNDTPPIPDQPPWQVRSLRTLTLEDYLMFEGPVVGYPALGSLLPGVPTCGATFYPLDRLVTELGGADEVPPTRTRLAEYLFRQLPQIPPGQQERVQSQIIALTLPDYLSRAEPGLVAVLLDADIPPAQVGARYRPITLDALDAFAPRPPLANGWLIAFDELGLIQPQLLTMVPAGPARLLPLRPFLREAGQAAQLRETCRRLAWYCWERAAPTGGLAPVAWALAAEYWLMIEDTTDLVALYPHTDFAQFVATGTARRVYRSLPPAAEATGLPPNGRTLWEVLQGGQTDPAYPRLFVLPALAAPLRGTAPTCWATLPTLLHKAGQASALARTSWLLSRDLLAYSRTAGGSLDSASITELAAQATHLYSLLDPWAWRQGRQALYLHDAYRHLQVCLRRQAQSAALPLKHYYEALAHWYGLAVDPAIEQGLEAVMRSATAMLDADLPQPQAPAMRRLLTIAHALLDMIQSQQDLKLEGDATAADLTVDYTEAALEPLLLDQPSPLFMAQYTHLRTLYTRWRTLQQGIETEGINPTVLSRLLQNFWQFRRALFAPAHEHMILVLAAAVCIQRLSELAQGVRGPVVKIRPDLPWVTQEQALVVTITNIGQEPAFDIHITPQRIGVMDLLPPTDPPGLAQLVPGESTAGIYKVHTPHPDQPTTLILEYTYRDRQGLPYTDSQAFDFEGHHSPATSFKRIANHYEAGRPIQDPEHFYGHRPLFDQIIDRLASGNLQPVLLRGPRRRGKTSLLYMVYGVLGPQADRYRRCLTVPPHWFPILDLYHPVFLSLQSIPVEGPQPFEMRFYRTLLDKIGEALNLDSASRGQFLAAYDARQALVGMANAWLEQVGGALQQRPGQHLLIILDEYDVVYRLPRPEALGATLRFVVSEAQRVHWLITSTSLLKQEARSYDSPWFNLLHVLEVRALERRAALDLIRTPSGSSVTWHEGALVATLEETGQRPYLLHLLCGKIIDHLNQHHSRDVRVTTVADVTQAIVEDRETAGQYFGFVWDESQWAGKLLLGQILRHPEGLRRSSLYEAFRAAMIQREPHLAPAGPERTRVNEIMKERLIWLEDIADAVTQDDQQRYRISTRLLRRWLQKTTQQPGRFEDLS